MKEPVLILSDLHLGHSGSVIRDVAELVPLLQDARTLILNGDTWQELDLDFQAEGRVMWEQWQNICREREIELVVLPGNHDPGQGSQDYAELANGQILVMHGDAIFPEVAPWSRTAMRKEAELREVIQAHPQETVRERFAMAKKISRILIPRYHPRSKNIFARIWDAIHPPGRAWRMLISWATMVEETRKFSARYFPRAEVVICGHFHRCGIWEEKSPLVINSGSFMPPGAAYWCEYQKGMLRVGTMKHSPEGWQRDEVLGVWNDGEG
jgi:predicted phosphodiesterase